MSGLPDDELGEIDSRAAAASPGPWFVRHLGDDDAVSHVAVGWTPGTGQGERRPELDHRDIVAATLVQPPRYVDVSDGRWDENTAFIACRTSPPKLVPASLSGR